MKRRKFIGGMALAGTAPALIHPQSVQAASAPETRFEDIRAVSPPVVQTPTATSFSVAWMVNGTATGWVEWGTTEQLGNITRPAHHGLAAMSHYALSARVEGIPAGADVYYRVVTKAVRYKNAYSIQQGEPQAGEIRKLTLPRADADRCHLAVINDTHDRSETISQLAKNINAANPDALIWNGDVYNTISSNEQMARIALTPGQKKEASTAGGWASTRPLLFTPGNHDARGEAARTVPEALIPWPMAAGDPEGINPSPFIRGRYCFTKRIGPVAIIGLDTGEDKPDSRDVWGGMAAYEPYREAQLEWLLKALQQPEIKSAPYLITVCHIPLHGLPGHNDGMGPEGYAYFSGFGQKLWLKPLADAGCQMVISGHMHSHRIDPPSADFPMHQVVGGGPKLDNASLMQIKADSSALVLTAENLKRETIGSVRLKPRHR
ncbi:metallophosphoesterase [Verrucomicrobiaceae bacterium R5-34]|nr:metallophosphoesterase [Verrucomicrobiaceae bacterium R5-34]